MKIVQSVSIPAALFGCLLVAWIGTMANSNLTYTNTETSTSFQTEIIQDSSQNNLTPFSCTLSEMFPRAILQWCALIMKYASDNSLPAELIGAVMLQESGGNPQAYSTSGAVGLLQVMPRDGLAASFVCINGPCFANRPSIKELLDPEYNISYGTSMLASLKQNYNSIRDALKAYGPAGIGYGYADNVIDIWSKYQH